MSCTVNHNLDILEESIGFCPKGICRIPRIGLYQNPVLDVPNMDMFATYYYIETWLEGHFSIHDHDSLTATESRAVGCSRAVEVLIIPVMA